MVAGESSVQEANKSLIRRYLEEIYRGNLDIRDKVIGEDYVGTAGRVPPAQYKANFGTLRRAFPEIKIRFDALTAEGDWVAMHCTIDGTHLGEWRNVPATGKHATWTATAFRRVRDGKVVQGYATFDWLSVLRLAPPLRPIARRGRGTDDLTASNTFEES